MDGWWGGYPRSTRCMKQEYMFQKKIKPKEKGLDRKFCLLPKPKLPINLKETVPLKGDTHRTEGYYVPLFYTTS